MFLAAPHRLMIPQQAGVRPTLDVPLLGGSLDSRFTFTRASIGWHFSSAGVLTSAAINAPRFDYDPVTLAPRGLLLEEPRTNLFLNSAVGVKVSDTRLAAPVPTSGPAVDTPVNVIVPVPWKLSVWAAAVTVHACVTPTALFRNRLVRGSSSSRPLGARVTGS